MIDLRTEAPLQRIFSRAIVSKREVAVMRTDGFVKSMVHKRLSDQFATLLLTDGALKVTDGTYERTYEVDLIVLTSDQLEKYVQRRAERLGYSPTIRFAEDAAINPKG